MTGLTVTVWRPSGRAEVPAGPTPVPGLVVAQHGNRSAWDVVHVRSGLAILKLPDPGAAQDGAVRLGELADWLLPGSQLRDQPGLRDQVLALAHELDCWELTVATSYPLPDDELAEAEGS